MIVRARLKFEEKGHATEVGAGEVPTIRGKRVKFDTEIHSTKKGE